MNGYYQDPRMDPFAQGQPGAPYQPQQFDPYGQQYDPFGPQQYDPYAPQQYDPYAPQQYDPYAPQQVDPYQPMPPQYQPPQPQYQPPQPQYQPAQPQYQPAQPQYQPAQPQYQPAQPQYQPAQPQYQPAQPQYQPAQPQYQPAQPQYQPAQPQYQPVQPQTAPVPPQYQPAQTQAAPVQSQYQPAQTQAAPVQSQYQPAQTQAAPVQPQYQPPRTEAPEFEPRAASAKKEAPSEANVSFLDSVLKDITVSRAEGREAAAEKRVQSSADFLDSIFTKEAEKAPEPQRAKRDINFFGSAQREETEKEHPAVHVTEEVPPIVEEEPEPHEANVQPEEVFEPQAAEPEVHKEQPQIIESAAPQVHAEAKTEPAAPAQEFVEAVSVKEAYAEKEEAVRTSEEKTGQPKDVIEQLEEEIPVSDLPPEEQPQPMADSERALAAEAAEKGADIVEQEGESPTLAEQMRLQLGEHADENDLFSVDAGELFRKAYEIGEKELKEKTEKEAPPQENDPKEEAKEYLREKERQRGNTGETVIAGGLAMPEYDDAAIEHAEAVEPEAPPKGALFPADVKLEPDEGFYLCRRCADADAPDIIEADKLSCRLFYEDVNNQKHQVLRDSSFKIKAGSICGVAADRAYDSYTLLSVLACCRATDGGALKIDGVDINGGELVEMPQVVYIDGSDIFDKEMTVNEFFTIGAAYAGKDSNVKKLIEECGFGDYQNARIKMLTLAQKAAIVVMESCISPVVKIVLLNVPELSFSSEDSLPLVAAIEALRRAGKTAVISTISSDYLDYIADSVIFLRNGKVAYNGAVADFCCASSGIVFAAKCENSVELAAEINTAVPELGIKTGSDGIIVCNERTMFDAGAVERILARYKVPLDKIVARPLCFLAAVREVFGA